VERKWPLQALVWVYGRLLMVVEAMVAYRWKTIGIVGCCLGGVIGPQLS